MSKIKLLIQYYMSMNNLLILIQRRLNYETVTNYNNYFFLFHVTILLMKVTFMLTLQIIK